MTEYLIKGDTTPVQITLTDADDNPVNLTGATVEITLTKMSTGVVDVDGDGCTVTDASGGVCEWQRAANEPSAAGEYAGELKVTYSGGAIKIYPEQQSSWVFIVREAAT